MSETYEVLDLIDQDLGFATISNKKFALNFKNGVVASTDTTSKIENPVAGIISGGTVWVVDDTMPISKWDSNFSYIGGFGRLGNWANTNEYAHPSDIAIDANNVYIVSATDGYIGAFSKTNGAEVWKQTSSDQPSSVTVLPSGNLAVAFMAGGTGGSGHVDEIDAATGAVVSVMLDNVSATSNAWSNEAYLPKKVDYIVRNGTDMLAVLYDTRDYIALFSISGSTLTFEFAIGDNAPMYLAPYNFRSFTYDSANDKMYVSSTGRIFVFDVGSGDIEGYFGREIMQVSSKEEDVIQDAFYGDNFLLFDVNANPSGKLIVISPGNKRISQFDPTVCLGGETLVKYTAPSKAFVSLTVYPDGYSLKDAGIKYKTIDLLCETPKEKIVIVGQV